MDILVYTYLKLNPNDITFTYNTIYHILTNLPTLQLKKYIKLLLDYFELNNTTLASLKNKDGELLLCELVINKYEDILLIIFNVIDNNKQEINDLLTQTGKNKGVNATILHWASYYNLCNVVKQLLIYSNNNENVTTKSLASNEANALHLAIQNNNNVVITILEHAKNNNTLELWLTSKGAEGCTPLHYLTKHSGSIDIFIPYMGYKYHEYMNIKNKRGETPLSSLSLTSSWFQILEISIKDYFVKNSVINYIKLKNRELIETV